MDDSISIRSVLAVEVSSKQCYPVTYRVRLTQRAPDVWDALRARFRSISRSVASSRFASCSQALSTPALVVELAETHAGTPLAALGGDAANR
jgi:hypothetical protein